MSWNYDVASLATDPTFQVRLLIGDTITSDKQLQDEEIDFYVNGRTTIYGAAADCCRSIASQKARLADSVQGDLRTLYASISVRYDALAREFDGKAAAVGAGPMYAGGISIADKVAQQTDPDRVLPQFQLGMDDNYLPVAPAGNETQQPGMSVNLP